MTNAFDTLGYSQHLRKAGVPDAQADAHAQAVREYVMQDVATKSDIQLVRADLQTAVELITLRLTLRLGAAGIGIAVTAATATVAILNFLLKH